MESILLHVREHTCGILETVFGKLIVTLPVCTEPSCVEVYDISWYAQVSQFPGDISSLLL